MKTVRAHGTTGGAFLPGGGGLDSPALGLGSADAAREGIRSPGPDWTEAVHTGISGRLRGTIVSEHGPASLAHSSGRDATKGVNTRIGIAGKGTGRLWLIPTGDTTQGSASAAGRRSRPFCSMHATNPLWFWQGY